MDRTKLFVIQQIIEKGFGDADTAIIDEFIHDDWKEHQANLVGGKKVLKDAILRISAAFSNRKYTLINHCESGDIIWVYYQFTGIHTGSFMGHPATNKNITMDVIDIARIDHERLIEHWGIPDRFTLLKQIGE